MGAKTIQHAAAWLQSAQHVVAFTGAGISKPSGIPDFRSMEDGLWHNVDPMKVASIYGFRKDPQAFFDWVRPLTQTTLNALPNPAHDALVWLEQMGKLKSIVTQNIDMLHTRAGSSVVFELHGHMREATCIHCFRVYDGVPILETFMKDGAVPLCPMCNHVIKPNVILFGEQLPIQIFRAAQQAARDCDLMLIVGSSLEVAPASDIPLLAQRTGARVIIINMEPTILDDQADLVIRGDAAELLPAIIKEMKLVSEQE